MCRPTRRLLRRRCPPRPALPLRPFPPVPLAPGFRLRTFGGRPPSQVGRPFPLHHPARES
eukprot:11194377-Lingulodinium_polyedra.AAC.1